MRPKLYAYYRGYRSHLAYYGIYENRLIKSIYGLAKHFYRSKDKRFS